MLLFCTPSPSEEGSTSSAERVAKNADYFETAGIRPIRIGASGLTFSDSSQGPMPRLHSNCQPRSPFAPWTRHAVRAYRAGVDARDANATPRLELSTQRRKGPKERGLLQNKGKMIGVFTRRQGQTWEESSLAKSRRRPF